MLGVSLTMWSHDSSSSLIFDRASEGVVETVLTLLAHHDGVGKAGYSLLQAAKVVAMGREEEALQDIEASANTPKAVTEWMDKITTENSKTEPFEKADDTLVEIHENVFAIEQVKGIKETETKGDIKSISEDSTFFQSNKQSNINFNSSADMSKIIKVESIKEQIKIIVQENQCNTCSESTTFPCIHKRKGTTKNKSIQYKRIKTTEKKLNLEPKHWLVCKICERPVNMKAHTRQVHGHVSSMEVVPCSHCCDWFLNYDALKEHMMFHDIKRDLRSELGRTLGPFLYCKLCSYNCYAKKLTRRVKTSKCKTGEQIAKGDQVMKNHMKTHGGMHPCGKCQKVFNSQYQLKEHTIYCWKIFQCDQCSAEFKCKSSLENHILGIHEQSFKSKCEKCDKKFTNDKSLYSHNAKVHTNMDRVMCLECGKSFRNGHSLRKHMKSHSHPKAFACDWDGCGRAFSLKAYLENHIRVHTNEKPFECDQCKQTFRKTSTLHRHKKTHTGEKSYYCQICGKGFIQKSNMKVHKCSSTEISDQAASSQ